ncbi:pyruvate, phosphate dikinase [Archangium gephyra]|nr:pyruvate, phosphate dikinase [Archangium gephyra]
MPRRARKTPPTKNRRRARPEPRLARAPKRPHVSKPSRASREKWVYLFDEGRGDMKELLGGKGANLAEMTRIGLPVPPGFIVTTRACNAFLATGNRFPEGLWEQELAALRKLEKRTGRSFGDPENALLVSCRSGARFSMPGMMDTLLNLGLNDSVVKGLVAETGDARFAYDAYRRLVQMFGTVVLGLPHEPFEHVLEDYRRQRGLENDAALPSEDLKAITQAFQRIIREKTGRDFPQEPIEQLRLATEAVFRSWNGKRAVDYRNAAGIAHDLGTAVNIVTMVFGNRGESSGTGVVTTRNVSTGEREMEGDYLSNAQGEDVVSGTRPTLRISALKELHPKLYAWLERYCEKLERHFRDVQDVEFTIEQGKLWMLQTRDAKRTAQAAVRIAVELAREKRITRQEAVLRVKPEQIDFFLHPQFAPADKQAAKERGDLLATGLNVSPGAASGVVALDADTAERWSKEEKKAVIMVRPETKPDDVHGMLAAQGILTSRGGRTSHAALVARQFGKPAVVGVSAMEVDCEQRQLTIAGRVIREGETVSIDGTTGELFVGKLETVIPDLKDEYILELLRWADGFRVLGVYANADYPRDAGKARELGAEGIGLCRTEHMFFETDRLPHVQRMILARSDAERDEALATLLPFQREDFLGLFQTMDGQPVTIRLIDPPLHEFLPNHDELLHDVTELETRLELLKGKPEAEGLEERLARKRRLLEAVESMREANPMLGLRGVRLGIHLPALVRMQVRAIFEAACQCTRDGVRVFPKVMIPLIAHSNELRVEKELLEAEARAVMKEQGVRVAYQFGTMIEIPRAALTADQLAEEAEFFSFGTNDLTQTTYGISRDDAETGFLSEYLQKRILPENPFATLDQRGVGSLMELAVKLGRGARPKLNIGICGEHGGDPRTIAFCHRLGLDYVSCSPFRVPIARLAAAHAALRSET